MNNKNHKGLWEGLKEKGYYIALVLCALAIGIGGYVFYQTTQAKPQETLYTPETAPVVSTNPTRPAAAATEETVPVIGTAPTTPRAETAEPVPTIKPAIPSRKLRPVDGQTAAGYSMDQLTYNETTRDWRVHNGIDLTAQEGTEVMAAADGVVTQVTTDDVLGAIVTVEHAGGYTTTYASLAPEPLVAEGERVNAGDSLGFVGTTALAETAMEPHVHFSVARDGRPVDPEEFLKN